MTWPYALLILLLPVAMGLVATAVGRLATVGARQCPGTVIAVELRRAMTGSPPYVPLIHRITTIRYDDQTGQAHTFRYQGPRHPAVGDTVTVAHRRRRPRLPRVVHDPPRVPADPT
jgi:hypothetical protein